MAAAEARFIDRFGGIRDCGGTTIANAGLLGDWADNRICICYLAGSYCFGYGRQDSPKGPSAQVKLWDAPWNEYERDTTYPGAPQRVTKVVSDRSPLAPCVVQLRATLLRPGPAIVAFSLPDDGPFTFSTSTGSVRALRVFVPPGSRIATASATFALDFQVQSSSSFEISATALPSGFSTPVHAIPRASAPFGYVSPAAAFPHLSASTSFSVIAAVSGIDATRTSNPNAPIVVTWARLCGATAYVVYRDDAPSPIGTVQATEGPWGTYTDSTAAPCEPHRYSVAALFGGNDPAGPRSAIAIGFAGLAFRDITLNTDYLQGQGTYSGSVHLWGPVTPTATVDLESSQPSLLSVPPTALIPAGSAVSNPFEVGNWPLFCPSGLCSPIQVFLTASSTICRYSKPFWVYPTDPWPELVEAVEQEAVVAEAVSGPLTVRRWLNSIEAVDANGDGRDDLIVLSGTHAGQFLPSCYLPTAMTVLSRDAHDGWSSGIRRPLGIACDSSIPFHGDINGDGMLDTVAVRHYGISVRTCLSIASATTQFQTEQLLSGDVRTPLLLLDVNGDGMDDLIQYSGNAGDASMTLQISRSLGDGQFATTTTVSFSIPPTSLPGGAYGFFVPGNADVDGDGRPDLLLLERLEHNFLRASRLFWLRNRGDGTVDAPVNLLGITLPEDVRSFAHVDLNGDGALDVVLLANARVAPDLQLLPATLFVYMRSPQGFDVQSYRLRDGHEALRVVAKDLDGDGDLDLVTFLRQPVGVPQGTALMQLWRQNDTGRFGYPGEILVPRSSYSGGNGAAIGDLNGDGLGDVVYPAGQEDFDARVPLRVKFRLNNAAKPGWFMLHSPREVEATVTGEFVFRWNDSTGAASYKVEVARDASFSDLLRSAVVTSNAATISLPVVNGQDVYWRVHAINENGSTLCAPMFRTFQIVDLNRFDCNGNGQFDVLDIQVGTSVDLNANGLPDECEYCYADFNRNHVVEVADIFAFLSAWFAQDSLADFDGNGEIQVSDIFAFLAVWFAGCP